MIREFSIRGYEALIGEFKSNGYSFAAFHQGLQSGRVIYLRHDVDLDLDFAVDMAKIENRLGVRSTYFFLINTFFYNLASSPARRSVSEIVRLGHEVGLHFDAASYPEADDSALEAGAREERLLLEQITGIKVNCLSFHRPARGMLGSQPVLAGMLNCYSAAYMRDIGYCSDSQGIFRFGHPLDHSAIKAGEPMQLVLHPIWWTSEKEMTPIERLKSFFAKFTRNLDQSMRENLVPWR